MKGLTGIIPAIAIIAILAAAGVGVGTPTALAEMQHRNITKFTPEDLPYGIMRAGEHIMGLYQLDKGKWNGELIKIREMERVELQIRCPNCTHQIQELEQEQLMIREQERIRIEQETRAGADSGNQTETRTRTETETQGEGSQSGTCSQTETCGGTQQGNR